MIRSLGAVLGMSVALAGGAAAQEPTGAVEAAPAQEPSTWTVVEILPLTCGQAWQKAGRSEAEFVRMLVALGGLSLENRGLSLPDSTRAKSQEIGMEIRHGCETDPDDLLYGVVDRSLRPHGTPAVEN